MKTSILITGSGMSSKLTLLRNIPAIDAECKTLPFSNYQLTFKTKEAATKALSIAYQNLIEDREDWKASMGSYRTGEFLNYDAGSATIF